MALTGWSSVNFLRAASTPVVATPCTLAGWFSLPDHTSQVNLMGIYNSADTTGNRNQFALLATTGAQIGARTSGGATGNTASTSSTFADSIYFHACGVFSSSSSRSAFLNGGGKATNSASQTPAGLNRVSIGCQDQSTASQPIPSGSLCAEWAIWSTALADAEVLMLAQGAPAFLVRPASIVGYWRGINTDNLIDLVGHRDLTIQGSLTAAAHPATRYWARSSRGAFHSLQHLSMGVSGVAGISAVNPMATGASRSLSGAAGTASLGTLAPLGVKGLPSVVGVAQVGALTPKILVELLSVSGVATFGALVADTAKRISLAGPSATTSVGPLAAAVGLLLETNGCLGVAGTIVEAIAVALAGVASESGIGDPGVADNWRRLLTSEAAWRLAANPTGDWILPTVSESEWRQI